MKKILPLLLLSFSFLTLQAQNLPHWMTDEERALLPGYLENKNELRGNDPPPLSPRAMAEWDEIEGILVTWTDYTSIVRQIVDYAQEECTVYIVCSDSNSVKTNLTTNGVPLTNIKFLKFKYNSIWSRDYGQWNVYKNDVNEVSLIDWIYNRPRPQDDTIPQQLAKYLGLNIYQPVAAPYDLVHTGGNFMVDGHGTGFSSKLILNENGPGNDFGVTVKTESDVDTIMKKYLGLNRYILMDTLPYDVIHHIDMHLKLLDEETLMWGEFPTGVGDGPQIEQNLEYVENNFLNCNGRPYKIVRIPMVPTTNGQYPPAPNASYRTYTNSVFINKTILIPTYREEYDTTAFRIYKEALPGYKVYGIDCDNSGGNIIAALGALHCITKEIGHSDPIWIDHAPLQDVVDNSGPFDVVAKIETPSGVSSATLFWAVDTSAGFIPVPMAPLANDSFYAAIPYQPDSTTIFYYINAESNSGRNVSKPLTAPAGWWKFHLNNLLGVATGNSSVQMYDPFPNPASSFVNIGFVLSEAQDCKLIVVDELGRTVEEIENGLLSSGAHKFTVDVKDMQSGIYSVQLYSNAKVYSRKLIVTR